jgi:hypothetical protein
MLLHVGKSKRFETSYYAQQTQKIRRDIYSVAEIKICLISGTVIIKFQEYQCMYVCTYYVLYMYVLCMYVCMYVCVRVYVRTYVRMYVLCMYVCVYFKSCDTTFSVASAVL